MIDYKRQGILPTSISRRAKEAACSQSAVRTG